jgi:hypothetical protein
MTSPAQKRPDLVTDDRGAIMVMGIFMCVLLVGALWYIAGLGDALIYRERMQEAADSVAFSAAIIEARGMNIIVMINLLMAAILAIRVAINMLKMLCTVMAAVFWGISLIPFCEWAAAPAEALTSAAEDLQSLDSEISPYINDALNGLNGAWKAIQKVTPALADAGAVEMETKYSPPVAIFESLVVSKDLPPLSFNLPVEDGSLDKLCSKAGEAVGGIFTTILGSNGVGSILGSAVSGLAGLAPGYFCELPGASGGSPPNLSNVGCGDGGLATSQVCDQADAATQDYNNLVAADASPAAISAAQTKMNSLNDSCQNGGSKAQQGCNSNGTSTSGSGSFTLPDGGVVSSGGSSTPSGSKGSDYAPAQVRQSSPAWHNGIDESQITSILTASSEGTAPTKLSPRFVNIAGQGKVNMPDPDVAMAQQSAWAQAEFFYDASGDWSGLQDDAMWNFYWRARFRLANPNTVPEPLGTALKLASASYLYETGKADLKGATHNKNVWSGYARLMLNKALADSSFNPAIH